MTWAEGHGAIRAMPRAPRTDLYKKEVGERLTATRHALELEAKALCEQIVVAQNTYSQWETGKNLPDMTAMVRLSKRYGITLDWIYQGDPKGLPHFLASKLLPKAS